MTTKVTTAAAAATTTPAAKATHRQAALDEERDHRAKAASLAPLELVLRVRLQPRVPVADHHSDVSIDTIVSTRR